MTVTAGQVIRKATSGSVIGCINDFNARVSTPIYNFATYHTGNLPKFAAAANVDYTTTTQTTYFTNPQQAIETAQFNAKTAPSLTISDTVIKASTLWSSMLSVTRALNKIRYFNANWYHNEYGTRVLKSQISGRAVFNNAFPAVTGGADSANGNPSKFWTREGTTSITLNPANSGITAGAKITAASFNNTVTNCYNSWYNTCYTGNQLTYNMYTCHLNCHLNCHGQRSRR